MIAAMKNCKYKIAKQNDHTEEREKGRDFTILVEVIGLLLFYRFLIISRIDDGMV